MVCLTVALSFMEHIFSVYMQFCFCLLMSFESTLLFIFDDNNFESLDINNITLNPTKERASLHLGKTNIIYIYIVLKLYKKDPTSNG
jgi:hypothetical protein